MMVYAGEIDPFQRWEGGREVELCTPQLLCGLKRYTRANPHGLQQIG